MPIYMDRGGDSGIESYQIIPAGIDVTFKVGKTRNYRYTESSTSPSEIEEMIRLAESGSGLNTYISTHIKNRYDSKW